MTRIVLLLYIIMNGNHDVLRIPMMDMNRCLHVVQNVEIQNHGNIYKAWCLNRVSGKGHRIK